MHLLRSAPRNKISHFAVVAIVRQPNFRPNQQDLAIQANDAAVEAAVSVHHRHSNVEQDSMARLIREDLMEHLPTVEI